MKDSRAFYRGREARGLGKPRVLSDGRASLATRRQWEAGWDEEDRLRHRPTAEQVETNKRFWINLKTAILQEADTAAHRPQ